MGTAQRLQTPAAPRAARYGFVPRPGAGIARMIKDASGAPIIGVFADSTSDQTDEWFELLIAWLGTMNTNMPVKVARWSDTAQGYGIPQIIQAGAVTASVAFVSSHYIITPDSAQNSVTGDLAGAVDVALADWTPAANNPALITKFGAAGQRSFRFFVEQTTGLLCLDWREDGTTQRLVKSSVAPTVSDGGRLRVAFELDVDDGAGSHAVKFYTGAAGSNSWTQLGSTQVASGGGVTSVFDSTTQIALGSRTDTGADQWVGTFYWGHMIQGLLAAGRVVAGYDPGLYPALGGTQALNGVSGETWSPVTSPVITFSPMIFAYNGSASGKDISYSADATRLALQTPIRPHIWYLSYGHNQASPILTVWDSLATQLRTRHVCTVIAVAQNPEKSPQTAAQIARQALNAAEIQLCAAMRGYALLNAYEVLASDMAGYVQADGIHPTTTGSSRWADEAKEMFLPWPTT